jgi:hypothetical protein
MLRNERQVRTIEHEAPSYQSVAQRNVIHGVAKQYAAPTDVVFGFQ